MADKAHFNRILDAIAALCVDHKCAFDVEGGRLRIFDTDGVYLGKIKSVSSDGGFTLGIKD